VGFSTPTEHRVFVPRWFLAKTQEMRGTDSSQKQDIPTFVMPLFSFCGGIMVHRTSNYPLGQLLLECLYKSQLSIGRFVLAVGYRNLNNGVRAFDGILQGGYPDQVFIGRLCASPLAPDAVRLKEAINQTLAILKEEEKIAEEAKSAINKAIFRPFFQAIPEEKAPSQISLFAFTGGHSRYTHYLPDDFHKWELPDRMWYLKKQVQEAFAKSEGRTLFMGKIVGYNLFLQYGESALRLTVDGELIKEHQAIPVADATIKIGSKTLTSAQAARLLRNVRQLS
jgi:hypothetical protein